MPKNKRCHAENRLQICLLCGEKRSSIEPIKPGVTLQRIKSYFFTNYDPLDQRLPGGICSSHITLLGWIDKGQRNKTMADLPPAPDYGSMQFPILTRGIVNDPDLDCDCSLCEIGRESVGTVGHKEFRQAQSSSLMKPHLFLPLC